MLKSVIVWSTKCSTQSVSSPMTFFYIWSKFWNGLAQDDGLVGPLCGAGCQHRTAVSAARMGEALRDVL